jgi:hypothetical protein
MTMTERLQPGDRIVVVGGPWPQRHGATGQIAVPPTPGDAARYPWVGVADHEVIVLLDDDPLYAARPQSRLVDETRGWSCVIARNDVAAEQAQLPLGGQP